MTTRLTPHFLLSELKCHDGTPVPKALIPNALAICQRAEVLRAELGVPLLVNSGYRTRSWNTKIGGAKGSLHLQAKALDLHTRDIPAKEMHRAYLKLIKAGKVPDGGVGLYANFLHIDTWKPRRWGL